MFNKFLASITKLLANISVAWKVILMAIVLFLGTVGITYSAYQALQSLRYQFSNIYDFMLVPITTIESANTSWTNAEVNLQKLLRSNITSSERADAITQIGEDNKTAHDIITRYDTEWVTTSSPQFTQDLRNAGKISLQNQEVSQLTALKAAITAYEVALAPYLASAKTGPANAALLTPVIQQLNLIHGSLNPLIQVNLQFADFSNTAAQLAFSTGIRNFGIALGFSLLISFIFSFLIITSITSRLGELTQSATLIQEGKLEQGVSVVGRDEISVLGTTFNAMAARLREFITTLEQRVAERTAALDARTRALAASTEVSRSLSTILDRDKLVKEVVEQLVAAFGYYYAHIYLFNESGDTLVMVGGTGEAGQTMLARGHTIPKGRGLVGRAAETNKVVLVPDTFKELGWLPNELLPETKAEIAVPISIGDKVLGVFDVQHRVINGLTEQDADLLQSIANQVAIALQNANIYMEAQHRAERETLVANIGQRIQSAMTIEDALQVAVRELGKSLKAERSSVQLSLQSQGNATK